MKKFSLLGKLTGTALFLGMLFATPSYASDNITACETAFAYGTHILGGKHNPDALPSVGLRKNRWGWAIEMDANSYESTIYAGAGKNNTNKGFDIGTVSIDRTGTVASLDINIVDGVTIKELHVYASDEKPSTSAPGRFGNTINFSDITTTINDDFSVEDTNGDGKVWFAIHAVACVAPISEEPTVTEPEVIVDPAITHGPVVPSRNGG